MRTLDGSRGSATPAVVSMVDALWSPAPPTSLETDALRPRDGDAELYASRLAAFATAHPPSPTLPLECARFTALGGSVAMAPSDVEHAATGGSFKFGLAADDFFFPICADGRHCSQVMHVALCSAMRALGVDPSRSVAAPHGVGAEWTNDPVPQDAGSAPWARRRVDDVEARDAWRAEAHFVAAFGVPVEPAEDARRGYAKASVAGIEALRELSAERKEKARQAALLGQRWNADGATTPLPAYMSAWFSRHYFARQPQHLDRRMVFICFGRSATVAVGRIVTAARVALERASSASGQSHLGEPGSRPCDNMHIIIIPWHDTIATPHVPASRLLGVHDCAAPPSATQAKRAHERCLRKYAMLIAPVLGPGSAARAARGAWAGPTRVNASTPLPPRSRSSLPSPPPTTPMTAAQARAATAAPYSSPTPDADALRAQIAELAQSLRLDAEGGVAMRGGTTTPQQVAATRHYDYGSGTSSNASDIALRNSLITSATQTQSEAAAETVPLAESLAALERGCAEQRTLLARFGDTEAIAYAVRQQLVEHASRVEMMRSVLDAAGPEEQRASAPASASSSASVFTRRIEAETSEATQAAFERRARDLSAENEVRRDALRRLEDEIVHLATQELRISRGDATAALSNGAVAFAPDQQLLMVEMAPPAHKLKMATAKVQVEDERRNLGIAEELRVAVATTLNEVQRRRRANKAANGKLIRELVGDSQDLQVVVAASTRNLAQKSAAAAALSARRKMVETDVAQLNELRALYTSRAQRSLAASKNRLARLRDEAVRACGGALVDAARGDADVASSVLSSGSADALIARAREAEQYKWNELLEEERRKSDAFVTQVDVEAEAKFEAMSVATFGRFEVLTNDAVRTIARRAAAQRRHVAECIEQQAQIEGHLRALAPLKSTMESAIAQREQLTIDQGHAATESARAKVAAVGALWQNAARRSQLDAMMQRLADAVQAVPGFVARRFDAGATLISSTSDFDALMQKGDAASIAAALAHRSVVAQLRAAEPSAGAIAGVAGCARWSPSEPRCYVTCFLGALTNEASRHVRRLLESLAIVLSPTIGILLVQKAPRANAPLYKRFGFAGGQSPLPGTMLLHRPWIAERGKEAKFAAAAPGQQQRVNAAAEMMRDELHTLTHEERMRITAGSKVAANLPSPNTSPIRADVAPAPRADAAQLGRADALEIIADKGDGSLFNRTSRATAGVAARAHLDAVIRALSRIAPLSLALGVARYELACTRERGRAAWSADRSSIEEDEIASVCRAAILATVVPPDAGATFSPSMQASVAPLLRASIEAARASGTAASACVARFVVQLNAQRALEDAVEARQLLQFRVQHTRDVGVRMGAGGATDQLASELYTLTQELNAATESVRRELLNV